MALKDDKTLAQVLSHSSDALFLEHRNLNMPGDK